MIRRRSDSAKNDRGSAARSAHVEDDMEMNWDNAAISKELWKSHSKAFIGYDWAFAIALAAIVVGACEAFDLDPKSPDLEDEFKKIGGTNMAACRGHNRQGRWLQNITYCSPGALEAHYVAADDHWNLHNLARAAMSACRWLTLGWANYSHKLIPTTCSLGHPTRYQRDYLGNVPEWLLTGQHREWCVAEINELVGSS